MAVQTDTYGLDFVFNGQDAVKTTNRLATATDRATGKLKEMVTQKGYLFYSIKRIASYSAIFTFFGSLVKMFSDVIELELRLAEVNTLIDKTNQDAVRSFENVTTALMNLDPHLGDVINLTKGLYEIISAGVTDPVQAFQLLVVSAKYAKVGLTDLSIAASSLTAVMKAYGYQASEMRKVSDYLFASVREGKFHTDELNAAIGKVLPTAAAMNVDIREISAALAIMTQRGLDVNEAATSLNRMLITFLRPLDKAKRRFQALGWQWGRNAFEGKGLIGALQDLESATKRYGDLLPIIFRRQRALRGAFILQGEGLRDLEDMYFRIDKAAAGAGIVHEEWGRITKTVREEMHALYANILQVFSALLANKGTAAFVIRFFSDLIRFTLENIKTIMSFVTALWLIPRVLKAIRVGFIQTMIVQAAHANYLKIAAVNVAAYNSTASRAAMITGTWTKALVFLAPVLAAAFGMYVYFNKIIEDHKKSIDAEIGALKESFQQYKELTERMRRLAEAYKELTGETIEWRMATKEAARESLIAQLNDQVKSGAWKQASQQVIDFAKDSGVHWTKLGLLAGDVWKVIRGEKVDTPERYGIAVEFLDNMAKKYGHLGKSADEFYKDAIENTKGLARVLIAADAKLRGFTKSYQSAQRLLMDDPVEIALRFDKDEIKNMLRAVRKISEDTLSAKELGALKLLGIDLEQLKKESIVLTDILGEAFARVDAVKKAARIDDFTRGYVANLSEIRYTTKEAGERARAMFNAWREATDTNTEVFKIWSTKSRGEIEKILATLSDKADPAVRAFLQSMLKAASTSVDALEKIRKKFKTISEKVLADRKKIESKIVQLQNEYLDKQHENILEQFKREKMAYEKRANDRFKLAVASGSDVLAAWIEHQRSMLQFQNWGSEAIRVSQTRALKKRLAEFKETLNSMHQNTQDRIDTTYEMQEAATKFLEEMGIADTEFMKVLSDIIKKYFDKIREETEAGRDVMRDYIKYFRSLATSLGFMAETLTSLADSMGAQGNSLKKMADLFSIAQDAADGFAKSLKTIKDSEALTGLAATLGKAAGVLGVVIAGFKLGWELGKFLKGLFGGDTRTAEEKKAAEAAKKLERYITKLRLQLLDLGKISDEVAKKIHELVAQGIPEHVAISMSLVDLMNDTGISLSNFEGYLTRMIEALGYGTTALWNMEEAAEVVGEGFSRLLEFAKKMGIEGHKALLDMIKRSKELGYEIKEITDYIADQLQKAAAGLAKMIKWVAADAVAAWEAMKDLNKEKRKLMNQMARYQKRMDEAKEGSEAWVDAKEKVEDLYKQILKLDKKLAKYQDVLNSVGNATVKQIQRIGVITFSVFAAMVAEGTPMLEIFNSMKDSVFALMARYKALGLEVPKYLKPMFKMFRQFKKKPEFFEGLQGLQEALDGLGNSGYLTKDAFKALSQEAKRYFDMMRKGKDEGGLGFTDEQAIRMMYPLLRQMWWYAEQYGMKLPKWAKDAMKEAKGLGLKFEKPATDQLVDQMKRLNDKKIAWLRKGIRDQLLRTNELLRDIRGKGNFQHGTQSAPGGLAFLHRGEAVLPETMTNALKRFFVGGGSVGNEGGGGMVEAHIYVDGERTYKALVPYIRKGGAYADFELDGIGVR